MCLFVATVLPIRSVTQALLELASRDNIPMARLEHALRSQLARDEGVWLTTRTHCDCGSELFSTKAVRTSKRLDREIQKLKKKGWSAAKIEKWVHATDPSAVPSRDPKVVSLAEWKHFMCDALLLPTTPYIGILGHFGDFASDADFGVAKRVRRTVEAMVTPAFAPLKEDVLYEFRLTDSTEP